MSGIATETYQPAPSGATTPGEARQPGGARKERLPGPSLCVTPAGAERGLAGAEAMIAKRQTGDVQCETEGENREHTKPGVAEEAAE